MKVRLKIMQKEFVTIHTPEINQGYYKAAIPEKEVQVLKDIKFSERIIRVSKSDFDSLPIDKIYENWCKRYEELQSRIHDQDDQAVKAFMSACDYVRADQWSNDNPNWLIFMIRREMWNFSRAGSPNINWDRDLFDKVKGDLGYHKQLNDLIKGEIIGYEIIKL